MFLAGMLVLSCIFLTGCREELSMTDIKQEVQEVSNEIPENYFEGFRIGVVERIEQGYFRYPRSKGLEFTGFDPKGQPEDLEFSRGNPSDSLRKDIFSL